ncbi:hypothetical protein GGR58DRAFT_259904 [Xylaria digitata]|nr:hypothetical protein GGR58DRAFT_259904 [Xylaria digitata]
MRNLPSERGRPGGRGFLQVAQVDIDDHDSHHTERRRLSGRERFRGTVQYVLRQTSLAAPHNANLPSAQSSPAFSDSALTDEDYLSLPIQQFDEVDLVDESDRYTGVVGSYGPEVVGATLSPSHSTEGNGLEVRVESYPLALSPGGLYTDDRLQDFGYRGSEEAIRKPLSTSSLLYNYKPVPLRWLFILILFCGLVAFLALSQFALRLLPDASNTDKTLPLFQNITEIRKRSDLHNGGVRNQRHLRHGNNTETNGPTGVYSTTVSSSTTKTKGQPTSSSPTSTTTTNSSTEVGSTTEVESYTETDSTTEVGGQHTTFTQTSTTTSNTHTESSSTTELEGQPTSPVQGATIETTATPTDIQNTTTKTHIIDVPTPTITLNFTQPDEHRPPTGPLTADPTPNKPVPNDGPNPDTNTKPEAVPTDNPQQLPEPSFPLPTTTTSSHSTTEGRLIQPTIPNPPLSQTEANEKQAGDEPPSQSSSKPTGVNPLDSPYSSNGQSTDESTDQSADGDKLTGQSKDQAADPSKGRPKEQSADQQTEPYNGNGGNDSSTIDKVPSVVTSSKTLPSITSTIVTTSDNKIITSHNILAQDQSVSNPTQLSGRPEQDTADDNKPFTTIAITLATETLPPPITTVFTTSKSITEGSFVEVTMTTIISGHIKIADPLTNYVTTTTYANGTVSTISEDVYDAVLTSIESDASGKPTKTIYYHILKSAQETILRDLQGFPTATLSYYNVESTVTLYDDNNIATATVATTIPETIVLSTLYDTDGRPTKTSTVLQPIPTQVVIVTMSPTASPNPNDQRTLKLRRMPDGIYFAGLMLPTLLAIFISIPIRMLNRNVKLYQGFHALASDRGACAAESLCLRTTGPASLLYGLRSLQSGQRLLGLSSILVVLSALTIPFSAEVFRLILQGPRCRLDEVNDLECSVVLGVFPVPAQVLSALLVLLIAGIALVALLLRRWKTGVKRNPWNILDMTQLAVSTDMQGILGRFHWHRKAGRKVDTKEFANKLQGKIFGLREWEENDAIKYGVRILTSQLNYTAEKTAKQAGRSVAFVDPEELRSRRGLHWLSGDFVPFFMLSWTGRILFLLLLSGVLIAVLTYDIVARGSEYQRGLTGKAVGVRFLFSGAGVLVSFAWGSFFNVSFLSPYKLLKRKRLSKGQAISLNPATNPFMGLWLAFVPSRRDLYLGVVAATAILSEVLPLYLGNIPCNGVQVESAETICVYLSVAILSIMILIVGGSFFIDWPSMGADPSTIVGAMYATYIFSMGRPLGRFFKKAAPGIV